MISSREEQEPKVVIGWSSTLKKTVYDVRELSALRKPASPGGTGYVYFNPTTNKYERPHSIDFFSPPPGPVRPKKNKS
jgi:hypothetical protein